MSTVKNELTIALLGAGGVRSPLFIQAAAQRSLCKEIRLYDIKQDNLERMHWIACTLLEQEGYPVHMVRTTSCVHEALEGVDMVVVAIRPGGMQQRAKDEEAAVRSGVIGQETVGVCGCAMAIRMLPALLDIANTLSVQSPRAWLLNFSNPVGITTLGLYRYGYRRIIGICDSANNALYAASRHLCLPPDELLPEAFGLNHLSWTRKLLHNEQDILPRLLQDEVFVSRYQDLFLSPALRRLGLFINEYLYYYYFHSEALQHMQREPSCRGRYLATLERAFIDALDRCRSKGNREEALALFRDYHGQRNATYMAYARRSRTIPGEALAGAEGYAGLALDVIESLSTDTKRTRVLIVPESACIPQLHEHAAVEVSCSLSAQGIKPFRITDIPESCLTLMERVARYESLTVDAILEKDLRKLHEALQCNPLVGEAYADKVRDALHLDDLLFGERTNHAI